MFWLVSCECICAIGSYSAALLTYFSKQQTKEAGDFTKSLRDQNYAFSNDSL